MNKSFIVADAGPLIAFGKIKQIELLARTLGKIIVPNAVFKECTANENQGGAKEILDSQNKKLIQLYPDPDLSQHNEMLNILGSGESNAILLASNLKAGLLIDEKLGRKTAQKMNLKIIGTAGVLLVAKKKKIIKKITPIIHELKNVGYYLSDELIKTVLAQAKESNSLN